MEQLIKITSEPIRMVRFSQNARLVNADNVDMERRKALARHMSFRQSAGQGGVSVEDIKKINHTFSKKHVTPQLPGAPVQKQVVSRQPQTQAPVSVPFKDMTAPDPTAASDIAVAMPSSNTAKSVPVQDVSIETGASYTAQRGAFEMRVAKGELTYLPPMVMTIITQRPSVHVEYLGGFNYVPPRDGDSGSTVNLFT